VDASLVKSPSGGKVETVLTFATQRFAGAFRPLRGDLCDLCLRDFVATGIVAPPSTRFASCVFES
jgi:hypothetical protein